MPTVRAGCMTGWSARQLPGVKPRPGIAPRSGSRHNGSHEPRRRFIRVQERRRGRDDIDMNLFARHALLPTGWAHDVLVDVGPEGTIRSVDVAFERPDDAEHLQGPLIPGMPNVHSHAFQR